MHALRAEPEIYRSKLRFFIEGGPTMVGTTELEKNK